MIQEMRHIDEARVGANMDIPIDEQEKRISDVGFP